jgi:hypothetical protein
MATLKGESAFAADEAAAQAQEQLEPAHQKFEEGRARWEAEASKPNAERAEMLRHLQATPYRTNDRGTSD